MSIFNKSMFKLSTIRESLTNNKYHILAISIFLALSIFYNWAYIGKIDSAIEGGDQSFVAYILNWNIHCVIEGCKDIYSPNMFSENDGDLTFSDPFFFQSVLAIPIYLITSNNIVFTFNLLIIIFTFVNSLGFYLLAKQIFTKYYVMIAATIFFTFSTYRVWNVGHFQNILIVFIPLLVYSFIKYTNGNKLDIKWHFLMFLCLVLQGFSSMYHIVFIYLLFVLLLIYYYFNVQNKRRFLVHCILTFIFSVVALFPMLSKFRHEQLAYGNSYSIKEVITYSSNIDTYFRISPYSYLGKFWSDTMNIQLTNFPEDNSNLSYVGLIFFIIALLNISRKKNIFWIGGAILFFILSLGPILKISGVVSDVILPYALVYSFLEPIRFIRVASRYTTAFLLFFTIISGLGIQYYFEKYFSNIKIKYFFVAILVSIFILETFPVYSIFPRIEVDLTKNTSEILNASDVKKIVYLPAYKSALHLNTGYMLASTSHWKPIVNGYSGFFPAKSISLLFEIDEQYSSPNLSQLLFDNGITHVVVYENLILNDKSLVEIYKDNKYAIYRNTKFKLIL